MELTTVLALSLAVLSGGGEAAAKWRTSDDWRPITGSVMSHRYGTPSVRPIFTNDHEIHTTTSHHIMKPHDECSISKVSMNQEFAPQFVQYKTLIPELKEFTLCLWMKFQNHTTDHPLFSYSVHDSPKELAFWVSNTKEASYLSMAVAGHTFFRLNYPLKIKQWYHSCQSWNGKTGEWQIWVNAERVGRGFHNRLVGHVIKGGGMAISGQDQSQLFISNGAMETARKTRGLIGEITLVQLYHVALTAGKAHYDHKHHHAHHFNHDGTPVESTPAPPQPPTSPPTPVGNGQFLIGNQLQRGTKINLANRPQTVPVRLPNGLQFQQQFNNGQLRPRVVSEQLLSSIAGNQQPQQQPERIPENLMRIIASTSPASYAQSDVFGNLVLRGSLLNPANIQYVDDSPGAGQDIFKREIRRRDKRDNPEMDPNVARLKRKRGLIALPNGSIIDDSLLLEANVHVQGTKIENEDVFAQSLLDGLAGFDGNQSIQDEQKQKVEDREPAEAEVKAVMDICNTCSPEPFKKALVFAWKSVPMKVHGGGYYHTALGIC